LDRRLDAILITAESSWYARATWCSARPYRTTSILRR
jgi:hypothetical protein